MFFVSDIYTTAPLEFSSSLQEKTYKALEKLHLPFERVNTDEAITMVDCVQIEKKLDMKMVKTLFLCNRQQTAFYLFIMPGHKQFKSKDFSSVLEIARVSFAPEELFEKMLGTKIGAATVFSTLLDEDNSIQVIFDQDIISEEWYGCSDGTTTGYMKIKTDYILHNFLPFTNHAFKIISF